MKAERKVQTGFEAIEKKSLECQNQMLQPVIKFMVPKAGSDISLLVFAFTEIHIFRFLLLQRQTRILNTGHHNYWEYFGSILHISLL